MVRDNKLVSRSFSKEEVSVEDIESVVTIYSVYPSLFSASFSFFSIEPYSKINETKVERCPSIYKEVYFLSKGKWHKHKSLVSLYYSKRTFLENEQEITKNLEIFSLKNNLNFISFRNRDIDYSHVTSHMQNNDFVVFRVIVKNGIDRNRLQDPNSGFIVRFVPNLNRKTELFCGSFLEFLNIPNIKKHRKRYDKYYYRFEYVIVKMIPELSKMELNSIKGIFDIDGLIIEGELKAVGSFQNNDTNMFDINHFDYYLKYKRR